MLLDILESLVPVENQPDPPMHDWITFLEVIHNVQFEAYMLLKIFI